MIGQDKILHFTACFVIAAFFAAVLKEFFYPYIYIAILAAWMISMLVGIIKEYMDSKEKNNKWDNLDLMFDFYGASLGSFVGCLLL